MFNNQHGKSRITLAFKRWKRKELAHATNKRISDVVNRLLKPPMLHLKPSSASDHSQLVLSTPSRIKICIVACTCDSLKFALPLFERYSLRVSPIYLAPGAIPSALHYRIIGATWVIVHTRTFPTLPFWLVKYCIRSGSQLVNDRKWRMDKVCFPYLLMMVIVI